jgi:hypothetical protein
MEEACQVRKNGGVEPGAAERHPDLSSWHSGKNGDEPGMCNFHVTGASIPAMNLKALFCLLLVPAPSCFCRFRRFPHRISANMRRAEV